MKTTGIVRRVDELGRVVIPIEIRRVLNIHEKDALEIRMENDQVILQKYEPVGACAFCSSSENLIVYREKNICAACLKEIKGQ